MSAGLIYRSPLVYHLAMRALYGRHYCERYAAVAALVEPPCSVTDVCCGDCALEPYIRDVAGYTGVDLSEAFVRSARKRGIACHRLDVSREPLPVADYVVMMGSLYQFIPEHEAMVRHMLDAAKQRVIILEPVRNLANSRFRLIRLLAARAADAGAGPAVSRFTESSLRDFLDGSFASSLVQVSLVAGGRDLLVVLSPP